MRGFAEKVVHEVVHDARAELQELTRFGKAHRTPWQPIPVLLGAVIPTVLFALVYFCCSFSLRFYHPEVAGLLIALSSAACIATVLQARARLQQAIAARGPLALATSSCLAFLLALIGGEENYVWHMTSYFEFQDLASYTNIDPNADKGQSYMDAGQIYFREFSRVDTEQMVVYRSQRVFCAAPILVSPVTDQHGQEHVEQRGHFGALQGGLPATMDFWAVGMDCCDEETRAFTCGAAGDPRARAGIRLLRNDIRPFYVLAVQEWMARLCPLDDNTLKIRPEHSPVICPQSRHPLFFHWVVDPLLEVDNFWNKGMSTFCMHLTMFFAVNLFLTFGMLYAFLMLGVR